SPGTALPWRARASRSRSGTRTGSADRAARPLSSPAGGGPGDVSPPGPGGRRVPPTPAPGPGGRRAPRARSPRAGGGRRAAGSAAPRVRLPAPQGGQGTQDRGTPRRGDRPQHLAADVPRFEQRVGGEESGGGGAFHQGDGQVAADRVAGQHHPG